MIELIREMRANLENLFPTLDSVEKLENFKLEYLVKKGKIQRFFDELKTVHVSEKPIVGKELNELRKFADNNYSELLLKFGDHQEKSVDIDLTLPGRVSKKGTYHPVLQNIDAFIDIFKNMGFTVAESVDIEDDFHNFDALNFPADHPARDMQDTFFIQSGRNDLLLRTHTSPVQIRLMKSQTPPIRSIMPGRVYRNESISARSLAEFHQIEGLCIDKNVTFKELKATMITFAKKMYGNNSKFRFRPSFFPFTEPSAEVDISCYLCDGKGCRVCKNSGWLEIAGCGMVHPNVLKAGGIDPEEYTGYAFGFGVERVTMLTGGIDDIRLLYDNDIRFLQQF
ncbi:MAG TPA: phenylalanine--tRNA ligase subunit alpha [Candidatus Kapabacteria bacterium]|nr:phenylalanine--tRNA ligase subunit alpha [Candidatus Kapabacteria bacterium]